MAVLPNGQELTGADAVVRTLANGGVRACFANPGTSEMHLVAALDREPRIRPVLCLFEGVATGAADGYARLAGAPAMTLLHLGPGYLNGGANLHNARRAFSPIVNVIGDHAVSHRALDAPLASDIAALAGPNSRWVRSADRPEEAGRRSAEALEASMGPPPGPVSLILPADTAWSAGGEVGKPVVLPPLRAPWRGVIDEAARAIRAARRPVVLVNGSALYGDGLQAASRLHGAGIRIITDTFIARQQRGAGRYAPGRLAYFAEAAVAELEEADVIILAGTKAPVAFFAYPGKPGALAPNGAQLLSIGGPETDSAAALVALAESCGARFLAAIAAHDRPERPVGALNAAAVGASLARHMPDNAIIADDGVTSALPCFQATVGAAPHDWLGHTGGGIGQGLPMAVGAAVAEPSRKVIALAGDGAAMYTVQALWTMARENLDITTIVFVNNAYRILKVEFARTGAGDPGPATSSLLSLGGPEIDWVKMAEAQGVTAVRATTAEEFDARLAECLTATGPRLIAALMSK